MEERITPWPKNFKVITANVHTSTEGTVEPTTMNTEQRVRACNQSATCAPSTTYVCGKRTGGSAIRITMIALTNA
eukprot:669429-Rhodomonas_salina.3